MIRAFGRIRWIRPDVREVVRHLVDEERRVALALDAGLGEVALAERAQFVRPESGQHLRIAATPPTASSRAPRSRTSAEQVGQLHRALDQRNGSRGSARAASIPRAAGPTMKIGSRAGRRCPARCGEELAREQRLGAAHVRGRLVGVVGEPASAAAGCPRRSVRTSPRSRRRPRAPCRARSGSGSGPRRRGPLRASCRRIAATSSSPNVKVFRFARLQYASPRPGSSSMLRR